MFGGAGPQASPIVSIPGLVPGLDSQARGGVPSGQRRRQPSPEIPDSKGFDPGWSPLGQQGRGRASALGVAHERSGRGGYDRNGRQCRNASPNEVPHRLAVFPGIETTFSTQVNGEVVRMRRSPDGKVTVIPDSGERPSGSVRRGPLTPGQIIWRGCGMKTCCLIKCAHLSGKVWCEKTSLIETMFNFARNFKYAPVTVMHWRRIGVHFVPKVVIA